VADDDLQIRVHRKSFWPILGLLARALIGLIAREIGKTVVKGAAKEAGQEQLRKKLDSTKKRNTRR
jgi:hypothetical protein